MNFSQIHDRWSNTGTRFSPSFSSFPLLIIIPPLLHLHLCDSPEQAAHYHIIIISGVGLSPLGTAATTGLLYQPQMIDDGDCGVICGMKIGRGNRSTRRKPAPAPLCPPQNPTWPDPCSNPGPPQWEASENRLSYGSALAHYHIFSLYV
jgi:hypothetical protein